MYKIYKYVHMRASMVLGIKRSIMDLGQTLAKRRLVDVNANQLEDVQVDDPSIINLCMRERGREKCKEHTQSVCACDLQFSYGNGREHLCYNSSMAMIAIVS